MSRNRDRNILPDDRKLLDRVQIWSSFFEKFSFDGAKLDVKVEDVPYSESDEQSIDSSNTSMNEFEDKSIPDEEQDPDFDVQKTLDRTLQLVQKREKDWRRNGLDKAMVSFDINVAEKVQNWFKNNDKYNCNKRYRYFEPPEFKTNGLEFEARNHESFSDDESLQSVNTAKYILSNRKKMRSTHFTTMTIKKFCYSNRKHNMSNENKINIDKKSTNNREFSSIFKNTKSSSKSYGFPSKTTCKTENENSPSKIKRKLKTKRRSKFQNLSYSLESSSDTSCNYLSDKIGKVKPKLISKNRNIHYENKIDLKSNSKKRGKIEKLRQRSDPEETFRSYLDEKLRKRRFDEETMSIKGRSQSEILFNRDSVLNSTEISRLQNKKDNYVNFKTHNRLHDRHDDSYPSDFSIISETKTPKLKKNMGKIKEYTNCYKMRSTSSSEEHNEKPKSCNKTSSIVKYETGSTTLRQNKSKPQKKNYKKRKINYDDPHSDEFSTVIDNTASSRILGTAEDNINISKRKGKENDIELNKKNYQSTSSSEFSGNVLAKKKILKPKRKFKLNNLKTIVEESPTPTKCVMHTIIISDSESYETCKNSKNDLNSSLSKRRKLKTLAVKVKRMERTQDATNKTFRSESLLEKSKETPSTSNSVIQLDPDNDVDSTKNIKVFNENNTIPLKIADEINKTKYKKTDKLIGRKSLKENQKKIMLEKEICNNTSKIKSNTPTNSIQTSLSRISSVESICSNNKSVISSKSFYGKEPHIVLYDPSIQDDTIENCENDKIIINKSTLERKIGIDLTQKFLNGKKSYLRIFSNKSTIIFILPIENEYNNSSDSELDVLEFPTLIINNTVGKIVEVSHYKPI